VSATLETAAGKNPQTTPSESRDSGGRRERAAKGSATPSRRWTNNVPNGHQHAAATTVARLAARARAVHGTKKRLVRGASGVNR